METDGRNGLEPSPKQGSESLLEGAKASLSTVIMGFQGRHFLMADHNVFTMVGQTRATGPRLV